MDYSKLDTDNFSDWQQVLDETKKSLSYQQCFKLKAYVGKYQTYCVEKNPDDGVPEEVKEALQRLNKQIHHLKTSQKKSFAESYMIPIVAIVIGGIVGFWLTQS
ncbi:hypothetical protein ACXJY6_00515 [Vibrio sp. RC27]